MRYFAIDRRALSALAFAGEVVVLPAKCLEVLDGYREGFAAPSRVGFERVIRVRQGVVLLIVAVPVLGAKRVFCRALVAAAVRLAEVLL